MKRSIKDALNIIAELNYVLDKSQKYRAIGVLFVVLISSGFELIGVSAILPFIQAMMAPEQLMKEQYVKKMMQLFQIDSSNSLLLLMGGALIVIYLAKNAYMIFSYFIQYDYSTRIQKELAERMLYSFMERPYEFFLDVNSSEVLRACSNDTTSVYNIVSYLLTIVSEMVTIVLIGGFIVYTDPVIAVGALMLMLLVLVGIIFLFKPIIKKAAKKEIVFRTLRYKTISQAIFGIKEIFVLQRKEKFCNEFVKVANASRKTQRTYAVLNCSPERITEGICVSGIIGIICINLITGNENMEVFIPKLAAFAMAAFKILPSIGKLANRITSIVYERPALCNAYNNIKASNEYNKQQKQYVEEKINSKIDTDKIEFKNKIKIDGIEWKYRNKEDAVLKDFSLAIRKGDAIALIGESGAGKSTISDILLGLLHPQKGNITVDGIDIYAIPKRWAQIVGYVPQSVYLLDDTVANNIVFGAEEVDEKKIWKALERAQLKSFIKSLPEGLDTIVGERGIKFSGGQRQRLAIARALYNSPEILVLDEATSALDTGTENAVMEAIDALKGSITMIIIAHRLSTIRNCDKIYEVTDGKAVECDKKDVLVGIV